MRILKTNVINSIQKVIHLIVLLAIGFTIINNALFIHTHQLTDGTIVIHAHPFNKTTSTNNLPDKSHNHTKSEFIVLGHCILLIPFLFALIALILVVQKRIFSYYQPGFVKKTRIQHLFLRGPPTV